MFRPGQAIGFVVVASRMRENKIVAQINGIARLGNEVVHVSRHPFQTTPAIKTLAALNFTQHPGHVT